MFNFFKKKKPKVLALVNHYYGKGNEFGGKSTYQNEKLRKEIAQKVISSLGEIPNIDIKVCGIKDCSLLEIDQDFSHIENPSFLIYETIEWMAFQAEKYDYFINIEDDILFTRETFERILGFDKDNPVNECFHPNRMEYKDGEEYCVDLKAMPGWIDISKKYKEYELRVANNPHSGVSIMSREKLVYAQKRIDLKRRDKIIGHYMASAYANLHSPFLMFRTFPNLSAHKVIHLDNWEPK